LSFFSSAITAGAFGHARDDRLSLSHHHVHRDGFYARAAPLSIARAVDQYRPSTAQPTGRS
jgi:hypothetical protein